MDNKILVRIRDRKDEDILKVLDKHGFTIEVFMGTPSQIMERVGKSDIGCIVVVCDNNDIYGKNIIERLKLESVDIPCVAVCEGDDMEFLRWIVSQNVYYFVTKPLNEHEFKTIVTSAIAKKNRESHYEA